MENSYVVKRASRVALRFSRGAAATRAEAVRHHHPAPVNGLGANDCHSGGGDAGYRAAKVECTCTDTRVCV